MKPWAGVGEAYASSYASLCAGTVDALLSALGPPSGRRLLDVGSGTGELADRFRRAGWDVTACEPEPTMRAVSQRQYPEVPVVAGGLPKLPFAPAIFDAVTANFVLNHVPDPRASAREMARVAAAKAPLGASIWLRSPSWFWAEIVARAGIVAPPGERLSPDKDFARTAAGFEAMLVDGGWQGVRVEELSWIWRASPATLWTSAEGGVASAGMLYLALDDDDRALFRRTFEAVCAEYAVDGMVPLEHTAAVAVGRAL
ncbi:class I SAM-dependent methyltransferase [Microbacterium sp. LWO12-1.2]|uniref:class I SAM-dependent methyltransferase n=1 Tax=Microbacterium sp. LWO12-1.2 TaxID=3135261 RepID=UPI0034277FF6